MAVGAEHKSDDGVHTYHSRTACAEEWQRYADNRSYLENHADVHDTVGKDKSESAHAYEFSQMVAAHAAVTEYFQADVGKDNNKSNSADEAKDLSCVGKDKVVVYLGNGDVIIRLSESPFPKTPPDFRAARPRSC